MARAAAKDSYVRPVMVASAEPLHPWVSIWRFRVVMLAVGTVLAAISIVFVQFLNGAYQGQDPTFEPGGSNLNQPVQTVAPTTPKPATNNPGGTTRTSPTPTPSNDLGGLGGGAE